MPPEPPIPNPLYFINVVGVGFDARTNAIIDQALKRKWGKLAYVKAVLTTLRRFEPIPMRLRLDNEWLEEPISLVAIGNGRSYGGGMHITPQAEFDDGWLDVCLAGAFSKMELLRNFPKVFRGTHLSHPKVKSFRAREIEVIAEQPEPISVDGDILAYTPATFRVLPGAVRFALPVSPTSIALAGNSGSIPPPGSD